MKRFILAAITLPLLLTGILPLHTPTVSALSGSDWKAGRIIDDALFTNASSMTVTDIQNFLNAQVPSCDTNGTQPATEYGRSDITHAQYAALQGWPAPPYVCLRNYYEVPKTSPTAGMPDNSYNHGGGAFTGGVSAAQLIYNAAQQYQISPKVLLVMIQKESAGPLTTDTWPLQKQYWYALGAHCPDSGPGGSANCDTNYMGFSIQISESAALLRWYLDSMTQPWWQYKKPYTTNTIQWNPAASCGGSGVYLETEATAALYTYTPYQPNAAALNNLYGTGDSCSAYGNRNFWRIYNDWFGPTIGPLIRTTSSSSLYYTDGKSKYPVPSMQVAAEYGLGIGDVRFVPQSDIDSLQLAGHGLSLIIKSDSDTDADGGNIYLISGGKRYLIPSMTTFTNFGFTTNNLTLVPYDQLLRMPLSGTLSNFVVAPSGFVYQITNGIKRGIFQNNLYTSLNPSGNITPLSDFSLSGYTTGVSLIGTPMLLKGPTGQIWYARSSGWHYVGTTSLVSCLGYNPANITTFTSEQTVIGTKLSNASCVAKSSSGEISLLDSSSRYVLPVWPSGYNAVDMGDEIITKKTVTSIPNPLVFQSPNKALYLITNGVKRYLVSMASFNELGMSTASIVQTHTAASDSIPSGNDRYASRTVLKDPSNGKLYLVDNDSVHYIKSMQQVDAFGLTKSTPVSHSTSYINNYQQAAALQSLVSVGSQDYFVDSGKSFAISSSIAAAYSSSYLPVYSKTLPASSAQATRFIKSTNSTNLYYLENGLKRYIPSWNTFTSLGGSSDKVTVLSPAGVSVFPSGSSM